MELIEFIDNFPNEDSCKQYFKEIREKKGVVCPKCGGINHYWKKDKSSFECKSCGRRISLKSGTVMHKSKLPFRYWFITIHLITSIKKTFAAKEIQRQLGHKRYQPIWHMIHKIREAMDKRDDLCYLVGKMELDHAFFSTQTKPEDKGVPFKLGSVPQKIQDISNGRE